VDIANLSQRQAEDAAVVVCREGLTQACMREELLGWPNFTFPKRSVKKQEHKLYSTQCNWQCDEGEDKYCYVHRNKKNKGKHEDSKAADPRVDLLILRGPGNLSSPIQVVSYLVVLVFPILI
jgi:hypothetical protein